MTDPRHARRIEHGGHCDCELLARALGLDPCALSFEYCQRVLHRHWRMTCRHGAAEAPRRNATADEWHELEAVDPVQAILLSNSTKES